MGTDDYFTDTATARDTLGAVVTTLLAGGASVVDTASVRNGGVGLLSGNEPTVTVRPMTAGWHGLRYFCR